MLGPQRQLALGKDYEAMVRSASKELGAASMKFIEALQRQRGFTPVQVRQLRQQLGTDFKEVKELLSARLIEVTEDRSR
jgi:hypothetical protein